MLTFNFISKLLRLQVTINKLQKLYLHFDKAFANYTWRGATLGRRFKTQTFKLSLTVVLIVVSSLGV